MLDGKGRSIDYMRISVTDRCNMRCVYCMPEEGVPHLRHDDILSYEEIARLTRIFASLGIKKIRLTGGEPLVRKDLHHLVAALSKIAGISEIKLTSNGIQLKNQLPQLVAAGLSGVNISLDALDETVFERITRKKGVRQVIKAIEAAQTYKDLSIKVNCVPSLLNEDQLIPLTRLIAVEKKIYLRFIELMPIGAGKISHGISEAKLRQILEAEFGPLNEIALTDATRNCRYFSLAKGGGTIGFISAVSHAFCEDCNRVRLTAEGFLKTCLQYDTGISLKAILNESDCSIRQAIAETIMAKPACHSFSSSTPSTHLETRIMSQIGG